MTDQRMGTREEELTKQELAIMQFLIAGQSNRVIAANLDVSVKTVEMHLTHIYLKLGVKNRTQAVLRQIRSRNR